MRHKRVTFRVRLSPGPALRFADMEATLTTRIAPHSRFESFVNDYGAVELARRLDISSSAVYHWMSGSTSPHPATALRIQTLATENGSALSLDEIYEHFREVRSERYLEAAVKPKLARR